MQISFRLSCIPHVNDQMRGANKVLMLLIYYRKTIRCQGNGEKFSLL